MLAEHHCRACGEVEGQALDAYGLVERVGLGEVFHGLVDIAEAAELGVVGAEDNAVDTSGSKDAVAVEALPFLLFEIMPQRNNS